MISLPDQFSAARLTQLDNGFKLMRSLSEQALDRTSRVFALQLDASRAAVQHSSDTMRQLFNARDPRDLLAIGSQSQQQLRSMFDYSRELFSIAAGVDLPAPRVVRVDTPALSAPATQEDGTAAQAAAEAFERIGGDTASAIAAATVSEIASAAAPDTAPATASATASDTAPATAGAASSIILQADAAPADTQASVSGGFVLPTGTAAAGIEVVTSDIVPSAAPSVIAKVTSEALDVPVAPPHPLAASVPVEVAVEIELPRVEPVGASPPPAAHTTGPVETRGTKGRKKGT